MAEQLREANALGKIILEPMGRNAPATALAALTEKEGDLLLLVLSADYVIADQVAFTETLMTAVPLFEVSRI